MIPEELDRLESLAKSATQGIWKTWGMQVYSDQVGNSNLDDAKLVADTHDKERGLRTFNADYIAAMGPETALSLIASAREAARLREAANQAMVTLQLSNEDAKSLEAASTKAVVILYKALQKPGEQQ